MKARVILGLLIAGALTGCATAFTGSPHIDRKGCEKRCESFGMELTGMVGMGQYSDGCICRPKGKSASLELDDAPAIAAAAAAGVKMQMDAQAQAAHHH